MGAGHHDVIAIVRGKGLKTSEKPFVLASGQESNYFVDGKLAFADGEDLEVACRALMAAVAERGIEFDAVGGLTMGADAFAHVIAVLDRKQWFVVRKERKERGTNKLIEGADIDAGTRVLLVDDVVTTGGSIQHAWNVIREQGATVVAAATLVDRGGMAEGFFAERGVPYISLVTPDDLDEIAVVGGGTLRA